MKDWINKQYQENISPEEKLAPLNFDFKEKSVIDLGCNIGLLSHYLLKRKAKSYFGIDNNIEYQKYWVHQKYWSEKKISFILKDLKDCDWFKADVIMAIGIFHHLTDAELVETILKIKADTIIIESPTQGQSNNYKIRSVEQYQEIFKDYKLTQRHDSGFKTPPVKREIMVFKKK